MNKKILAAIQKTVVINTFLAKNFGYFDRIVYLCPIIVWNILIELRVESPIFSEWNKYLILLLIVTNLQF